MLLDDGEQNSWENGSLGRDVTHMKVVSKKKTDKFLENKKTYATSIRLPQSLVIRLKDMAEKHGLNYQTYLKMVLTTHVNKKLKN